MSLLLLRLRDAVEVYSVLVVEEVVLLRVDLNVLPAGFLPPARDEVHLWVVVAGRLHVELLKLAERRALESAFLIIDRLHLVSPVLDICEAWALLSIILRGPLLTVLGFSRASRVVELIEFDKVLASISQAITSGRR